MKFLVNDECVCELNETQKKVICNDINCDEFEQDMKRRVNYIIMHKYEQCMKRLKSEWLSCDESGQSKLSKCGISSMPLNDEEFAELVFAQESYRDRKSRELEAIDGKL